LNARNPRGWPGVSSGPLTALHGSPVHRRCHHEAGSAACPPDRTETPARNGRDR